MTVSSGIAERPRWAHPVRSRLHEGWPVGTAWSRTVAVGGRCPSDSSEPPPGHNPIASQGSSGLSPTGFASIEQLALAWWMSFDALLVVDDRRRYRRVNPAGARLLGASREKVLRRRLEDFTPPEYWGRLDELWAMLRRDRVQEGYYEVLRGDGSRAPIEYRAAWDFHRGEYLIVARELSAQAYRAAAGWLAGDLLTARELEVMQLTADGLSASEAAARLDCSVGTVKTHLHRVYWKLGARDRAAAVAECLRRGLIS